MNYKKYFKKAIAIALYFFLVNAPLILAYKNIDDKDNIIKIIQITAKKLLLHLTMGHIQKKQLKFLTS